MRTDIPGKTMAVVDFFEDTSNDGLMLNTSGGLQLEADNQTEDSLDLEWATGSDDGREPSIDDSNEGTPMPSPTWAWNDSWNEGLNDSSEYDTREDNAGSGHSRLSSPRLGPRRRRLQEHPTEDEDGRTSGEDGVDDHAEQDTSANEDTGPPQARRRRLD